MATYTTIPQIKNAIIAAYQGVDELSKRKDNGRCTYSGANSNGIGCAFGCLLPEEMSVVLDDIKYGSAMAILYTMHVAPESVPADSLPTDEQIAVINLLFTEYFDMAELSVNEMMVFQRFHDMSDTVESFMLRLNRVKG